ncbi:hypothetical protein BC834DRAFT_879063 [Gloeopeniophorella convolvens]|nr:hypothetical protein BC834DRAFT_879063 [Gloeopeniophorella convolvens]
MTFETQFRKVTWGGFAFKGRFDHKRDALSGTWSLPDSFFDTSAKGQMEFRRTPPRYLVLYPSIKDISKNKYHALWRFAITVVAEDCSWGPWSWSYFSKHRNDRRAMISLSARDMYLGTPLDEEEEKNAASVAQRLIPDDACFYSYEVRRRLEASTYEHPNNCDSCQTIIHGTRFFCIDCVHKDTEPFDPLDLCDKSRCLAARLTGRQDIEGAHEPKHHLVKARTVVHTLQYGRVYAGAKEALKRLDPLFAKLVQLSQRQHEEARKTVPTSVDEASIPEAPLNPLGTVPDAQSEEPVDGSDGSHSVSDAGQPEPKDATDESQPSKREKIGPADKLPQDDVGGPVPSCGECKGLLSFPFWCCVSCEDDLLICDSCDAKGVPPLTNSAWTHPEEHCLVRCQAPESLKEDPTSASMEQRILALSDRLDSLQTNLETRLGNLEHLLHEVVGAKKTNTQPAA